MKRISVQDLHNVLHDPEQMKTSILIDVRSPEEYFEGHIPGAHNKPLDKIALYKEALRAYDHVYVQCRTGGRSSAMCGVLDQAGFKEVYNGEGGITAWEMAGFPIE